MTDTKHTLEPWTLEIGEDHCFHPGNRVAITVSGEEDGEPFTATIAELWPADNDMDIKDGLLMAAAPDLLAALRLIAHQRDYMSEHARYDAACSAPAGDREFDDWAAHLVIAAIAKAEGR